MSDIVELLEQWRDYWEAHDELALRGLVQRARDEIVALRRQTEYDREYLDKARPNIRAEALEEAARAVMEHEGGYIEGWRDLVAAIRALKAPEG